MPSSNSTGGSQNGPCRMNTDHDRAEQRVHARDRPERSAVVDDSRGGRDNGDADGDGPHRVGADRGLSEGQSRRTGQPGDDDAPGADPVRGARVLDDRPQGAQGDYGTSRVVAGDVAHVKGQRDADSRAGHRVDGHRARTGDEFAHPTELACPVVAANRRPSGIGSCGHNSLLAHPPRSAPRRCAFVQRLQRPFSLIGKPDGTCLWDAIFVTMFVEYGGVSSRHRLRGA